MPSPGAINSSLNSSQVIWPPQKPGYFHAVDTSRKDHRRSSMLLPIVGHPTLDANVHRGSECAIRTTIRNVQIGRYKFKCKEKEESRSFRISRASWFSMKSQHAPKYHAEHSAEEHYDENELLYGRFLYFVEVTTPEWIPQPDGTHTEY